MKRGGTGAAVGGMLGVAIIIVGVVDAIVRAI